MKKGIKLIILTFLRFFLKYIRVWYLFISGKKSKEFIMFPVFNSPTEMIDQIYRLTWYLPVRTNVSINIYYYGFGFSEKETLDNSKRPWYMHSLPINLKGLNFVQSEKKRILNSHIYLKALLNSIVIVWLEPKQKSFIYKFIEKLTGNIRIVDHRNRSYMSGVNYVTLIHKCGNPKKLDNFRDLSKSIFLEKVKYLKKLYKKAYIFGRGPSLGNAFNYDFSDGVRIICNQIIRDQKLMKYINPHFVVAGDHYWHYGCSKMSDCFRKDVVNYIMGNEAFLLMPLDSYPLMICHYPEIKGKSIGIPYSSKENNFNLIDNFFIKPCVSGLLEYSFPVACTVASDIKFLGLDGATKQDTVSPDHKVPYAHYRAAVYPNEIVNSIHASRPGYYDRDFSNFRKLTHNIYQSYDSQFELMVNEAEAKGFRFETLAPSYLKALKDKFKGRV